MKRKFFWEDMRVILAIATTGSLSGAARSLDLSHATVFRRLNEIEARLGVTLFERDRSGYSLTVAGEEAARAARRIEAEVLEAERRIAGRDLRPSGTVRVTTTDTLMAGLLSPLFTKFRERYPEITLEIAISNQRFNLSKRDADVAIRPTAAPPEALVGRKIGVIAQAVYGHRSFFASGAAEAGVRTLPWVGPDERMAYRDLERWMAGQGLNAQCHYRVDTMLGMWAAVRQSAGLAVLPCYLGDQEQALARLGEPIAELATDLWLLTHPDLRKTTRIRAFLDFIAAAVKESRRQLNGVGEGASAG